MIEQDKKEFLKEIIRKLHEGANPEKIKEEFKEVFEDVSPTEISRIEGELIHEGMQREEIQKLCDVHLSLFKESLEKERVLAPPGHPIHILMEEHTIMLGYAEEGRKTAKKILQAGDLKSTHEEMQQLSHVAEQLRTADSHYLREENILFPYLEKHGITEPPAVMWMEHDKIRELRKKIESHIKRRGSIGFQEFANQLEELATSIFEVTSNHFYKENRILYPTSLKVIVKDEWMDIRHQFDEIGYCNFTPKAAKVPLGEVIKLTSEDDKKEEISFEMGALSEEEIEAIFNNLPVDVTFVDREDKVRYFSQSKDRIFVRTKAVIGRKVQQCHPQKSAHVVDQILKDFKSGSRNAADFWINLENKLVYIRYFPVRNKNGDYLGCLEVTQDITDIKKIDGEKRLLDQS